MVTKNKKSQVWVETVIYTLIGLVLIGTVLAFATPAIQKQKDKAIIEKTSNAMNELDNVILIAKREGIGNVRQLNFQIGKGEMTIDGENDQIIFKIKESLYQYSEAGRTITVSGTNMEARTMRTGKKFTTTLALDYTNKANITYKGDDEKRTIIESPTPYNLLIENKGKIPTIISCTTEPDLACGSYECVNGLCRPKYANIDIYEG